MVNLILRIFIYSAIIVIFLFGYIKYLESRSIFYPDKNLTLTPEEINLAFESPFIKTADNLQINAWFIPAAGAKYTFLFCHGNAGNLGHRLDKIRLLHNLGVNILILDYRGFGKSQGKPSEKGLYLDAQAGYDYLINQRKLKPEEIILYGESIGSAAVINLAKDVKVKGIIVEGSFSCGRDMAKRLYPFLPAFMFSDTFNSLAKIKAVSAPKLFIHSQDDEIVPISLAKKLFAAAGGLKQFAQIKGDHNSGFWDAQDIYLAAIKSFIAGL